MSALLTPRARPPLTPAAGPPRLQEVDPLQKARAAPKRQSSVQKLVVRLKELTVRVLGGCLAEWLDGWLGRWG